jgi:hypothetical protein
MNNKNQNPEENIEQIEEQKTSHQILLESVEFVVDMMNSGKPNPKDVYPPGRYHGD